MADEKWPGVAEGIAARIRAGSWPVGSQLPAYPVLAAEMGVAQLTARKAVGWLAECGWLEVVQSVGVTVKRRPPARLPARGARRRDPLGELEVRLTARVEALEAEVAELRDLLEQRPDGGSGR